MTLKHRFAGSVLEQMVLNAKWENVVLPLSVGKIETSKSNVFRGHAWQERSVDEKVGSQTLHSGHICSGREKFKNFLHISWMLRLKATSSCGKPQGAKGEAWRMWERASSALRVVSLSVKCREHVSYLIWGADPMMLQQSSAPMQDEPVSDMGATTLEVCMPGRT